MVTSRYHLPFKSRMQYWSHYYLAPEISIVALRSRTNFFAEYSTASNISPIQIKNLYFVCMRRLHERSYDKYLISTYYCLERIDNVVTDTPFFRTGMVFQPTSEMAARRKTTQSETRCASGVSPRAAGTPPAFKWWLQLHV